MGATTPSGVTAFFFHVGVLKFHSADYEWLVVAGKRAQFKGVGQINQGGTYGFLLTAIDGDLNGGDGIDKFRIKIWDKLTDTIIYDNQLGSDDDGSLTTAIEGGSIVIHEDKKASPSVFQEAAVYNGKEILSMEKNEVSNGTGVIISPTILLLLLSTILVVQKDQQKR